MCGLSFVVGGGAVVFVNSRNIPFKFGQNWVSNSFDIVVVDDKDLKSWVIIRLKTAEILLTSSLCEWVGGGGGVCTLIFESNQT